MIQIAETELTKQLKRQIWQATSKQGTFGCFEVTIGFNSTNPERVDYITYNTKGEWRCYEVKISKSDFHSKAKNTFIGHFNYYVLTEELYSLVKDEIPKHIGVYIGGICRKRVKRQELQVDENILKDSMIRSLYREFERQFKSGDDTLIQKLNRSINRYKRERNKYYKLYDDLLNEKYEEKYKKEFEE